MEQVIYGMSGAIILILLGIIGYFISRNDKRQDSTNSRLGDSIDKLNGTMTGLSAVLLVLEESHKSLKERFDRHELKEMNIKNNPKKL